ncbi:MAG: hypothetical protein ACK4M1_07895 [Flavobacterium sp.]
MKKAILFILFFCNVLIVFGQTETTSKEFHYSFDEKKKQIIYSGNNNYFTIKLKGKKVKLLDNEINQKPMNQNFLEIDGLVVGFSIIDIPNNNSSGLDSFNLSQSDQERILKNYIEYELRYMQTQLNMKINDLSIEMRDYKSKSYFLVNFKSDFNYNLSGSDSETITKQSKGQIYLCSIQFNKILVINVPFFEEEPTNEILLFAKGFVKNIKSFNKKYN